MDSMHEPNLKDLLPREPLNRRLFVTGGVMATGFALSVQPVQAQTAIVTDMSGITGGEVSIKAADRSFPAYAAMPATGGPFPVVLVISEIWGAHEWVRDVSRRLAKQGYLAIAAEFFVRQGDVAKAPNIQEVLKIVNAVPDKQVMSDLDAVWAWAAASGKGNMNKVAVTGFCWGGRQTWLYAAHNPKLKAAVAWYGQVKGATSDLKPKNVVDIVGDLKVPVLGLYGAADTGIPVPQVEEVAGMLAASSKKGEIVMYPATPHGFLADYRPSYTKASAEDAWKRMLEWLKKNGVA